MMDAPPTRDPKQFYPSCTQCVYYVPADEPDYLWQGTCHRYPVPEMDNAGPKHWCGEYRAPTTNVPNIVWSQYYARH